MARWRWTALVLVLALVGVPLAMPFVEVFLTSRPALTAYGSHLWLLLSNTLMLVAGALMIAVPLGTIAAVLLYRTTIPGRHFFRFLVVLALFVPPTVLTMAWQVALGRAGLWTTAAGRPWAEGIWPAIWIHSQWALPWVILIVGQGLRWVEPELEEDALLVVGPWRVLWAVTLPRARGSIAAAAIWIAIQASGDLGVADLMQVDTFAREVYNQFSRGGGDNLSRALLLSIPYVCFLAVGVYWVLINLDRLAPPLAANLAAPRPFNLGLAKWPALAFVVCGFALVVGVPLQSLVWRTGLVWQRESPSLPPEWYLSKTVGEIHRAWQGDAVLIGQSIVTLGLSAAVVASAALVLCWLAQDAPIFRRGLFALLALAWALPGPISGIGLKETIGLVVQTAGFQPLSIALYYGPSPLPVFWANLIRFLPCAVVALWPVMRLLPRQLRDAMRLDGASPSQELLYLVWPLLLRPWFAVVVVISALALGDVGAVAMPVETPGWHTFAHELFNRLHYGQGPDVTALCLVLLLVVAVAGGVGALVRRIWNGHSLK